MLARNIQALAKTTMDTYRKILLLLKYLLHKSDNANWEEWIDKDIYEWDTSNSTSHHKSAFGGMGSINDLSVGAQGKIGTWENNMFDFLKNISWTFAAKNKIQFPVKTSDRIEGTICRDCSCAGISESGIERYLSNRHLPAIIASLLLTDQYSRLTDIEALTNNVEVAEDRQKILAALTRINIHFTKTDNWWNTCPDCNSTNTCVYVWTIANSGDTLDLIPGKNNLPVKKTSWWRRLKMRL